MPQAPTNNTQPAKPAAQRVQEALFSDLRQLARREQPELELDAQLTMSTLEVLQKKDFAQMTAAEIAQAKAAIARLVVVRGNGRHGLVRSTR
jgi:uncharacterized protein with von Willebrand factor type A (vWA) domain